MTTVHPVKTPRSADRVNVFVISNDQVLITSVTSSLAHFTTLAYGNGQDHTAIQQAAPHVVILDMNCHVRMLNLVPRLKDVVPDAKTILLAGLGDLVEACRSAVDGIVLTTQPPEVLVATVHYLMLPRIDQYTISIQENHQHNGAWPMTLTELERQIVGLISAGLSNKEIAAQVCAAPITVRHHLTRIFAKFGVADRQNLMIKTFQLGMVRARAPENTETAVVNSSPA